MVQQEVLSAMGLSCFDMGLTVTDMTQIHNGSIPHRILLYENWFLCDLIVTIGSWNMVSLNSKDSDQTYFHDPFQIYIFEPLYSIVYMLKRQRKVVKVNNQKFVQIPTNIFFQKTSNKNKRCQQKDSIKSVRVTLF